MAVRSETIKRAATFCAQFSDRVLVLRQTTSLSHVGALQNVMGLWSDFMAPCRAHEAKVLRPEEPPTSEVVVAPTVEWKGPAQKSRLMTPRQRRLARSRKKRARPQPLDAPTFARQTGTSDAPNSSFILHAEDVACGSPEDSKKKKHRVVVVDADLEASMSSVELDRIDVSAAVLAAESDYFRLVLTKDASESRRSESKDGLALEVPLGVASIFEAKCVRGVVSFVYTRAADDLATFKDGDDDDEWAEVIRIFGRAWYTDGDSEDEKRATSRFGAEVDAKTRKEAAAGDVGLEGKRSDESSSSTKSQAPDHDKLKVSQKAEEAKAAAAAAASACRKQATELLCSLFVADRLNVDCAMHVCAERLQSLVYNDDRVACAVLRLPDSLLVHESCERLREHACRALVRLVAPYHMASLLLLPAHALEAIMCSDDWALPSENLAYYTLMCWWNGSAYSPGVILASIGATCESEALRGPVAKETLVKGTLGTSELEPRRASADAVVGATAAEPISKVVTREVRDPDGRYAAAADTLLSLLKCCRWHHMTLDFILNVYPRGDRRPRALQLCPSDHAIHTFVESAYRDCLEYRLSASLRTAPPVAPARTGWSVRRHAIRTEAPEASDAKNEEAIYSIEFKVLDVASLADGESCFSSNVLAAHGYEFLLDVEHVGDRLEYCLRTYADRHWNMYGRRKIEFDIKFKIEVDLPSKSGQSSAFDQELKKTAATCSSTGDSFFQIERYPLLREGHLNVQVRLFF